MGKEGNVLIGTALLVKSLEDCSDGVLLVGTLILNIIGAQKEDLANLIPIRANNLPTDDSVIHVRNIRDTKFVFEAGREAEFQSQLDNIKKFVRHTGAGNPPAKCYTCDVRIPLVLKQVSFLSFPFRVFKASLKIEFSTTSVDAYFDSDGNRIEKSDEKQAKESIQLRPTIADTEVGIHEGCMGAKICEVFVSIRNVQEFDQSKDFDVANYIPSISIPEIRLGVDEHNAERVYFPRIEMEWIMMGEIYKSVILIYVPILVLLALQWINYSRTLSDSTENYFQNAITIVLALIVLIPAIREGWSLTLHSLTFIDVTILVFFVGTTISSIPSSSPAMFGLIISTASLFLPWYQLIDYYRFVHQHEAHKYEGYTRPENAVRRDGEIVTVDRVVVRTTSTEFPKGEGGANLYPKFETIWKIGLEHLRKNCRKAPAAPSTANSHQQDSEQKVSSRRESKSSDKRTALIGGPEP